MTIQTTAKLRVVITDNHEATRRGLRIALQNKTDRFMLVGEAKDGLETIEICTKTQPDGIILDLHLPGKLDGPQVIRALRQRTKVKILIYTGDEYTPDQIEAFSRLYGVDALVSKEVDSDEVCEQLWRICTTSPEPSLQLEKETSPRPLTAREKDILKALVEGKNPEQIQAELVLSKSTLNTHLANIYRKLSALSGETVHKTEAVVIALKFGLLD